MRIAIGADHAGYSLKEELKKVMSEKGVDVVDFGTFSNESVDYPDFAAEVGTKVASGEFDRGVLVCGTGIGISIAANKVPGVRAALCDGVEAARLSRLHNDANVLALSGRSTGVELAREILLTWLETDFEGGRHVRRVDKIAELERRFCRSNES